MNAYLPKTNPITPKRERAQAFAVWLTGQPASGKSTITASLVEQLAERGVDVAVLESDAWRKTLTPHATYSDEERDVFYTALAAIGQTLVDHGVPVIFDATANLRAYRDRARQTIHRFIEVYVDSPLETCVQRDPKGIYRRGQTNEEGRIPGVQTVYEPPLKPEVEVNGEDHLSDSTAVILKALNKRGWVSPSAS